MRHGVSILTDVDGSLHVYPGTGNVTLPLADITANKNVMREAAVAGLRIGKRVFVKGMVVSQYGREYHRAFPVIESKKG